ncbi:MAG: hypothetical protein E6I45_05210 [Chloroflexi bacterium]|nr:MAG: hypothetical protein E6I45_05210 [Chloroflexota bacterium]
MTQGARVNALDDIRPAESPRPAFAHASEEELARILDFYEVRWEYEPHVFPILWNLDGAVLESFAPDFYLPDLDLYVELTTLKQSLVRKKNRKLRRLRELYPEVRIKLFYGRDFRALMLKYGKVGLVNELSGTPGQTTPTMQPESVEPNLQASQRPGVDASIGRPVAGKAPGPVVAERPRRRAPASPAPSVVGRPPRAARSRLAARRRTVTDG